MILIGLSNNIFCETYVYCATLFNFRQFNQRFPLPQGLDVAALATEVRAGGRLVITAPQIKEQAVQLAERGDVDIASSSEARKITSEASFEIEGGMGTTKKLEDSKKKSEQKVTKRETEDGWEEEIIEEYEEEVTTSSTTTTMSSSSGGAGGIGMKIPLKIEGIGAAGGSQTIEVSTAQQNIKARDGKVIEMQKTADHKCETKEMTIPIQIEGRPALQQAAKTPKVRMLPFEFPSLPSIRTLGVLAACWSAGSQDA
jgi:hypothetical protein